MFLHMLLLCFYFIPILFHSCLKCISKYILGYFYSCYSVEDEKRVYNDLQIECFKGPHLIWSLAITLPFLVLWGIGVPLATLHILKSNKARLFTLEMK